MEVGAKQRLKWAREILLIARDKLAIERDRADHGHAIDIIQIIAQVDAVGLICKEVSEDEDKR